MKAKIPTPREVYDRITKSETLTAVLAGFLGGLLAWLLFKWTTQTQPEKPRKGLARVLAVCMAFVLALKALAFAASATSLIGLLPAAAMLLVAVPAFLLVGNDG